MPKVQHTDFNLPVLLCPSSLVLRAPELLQAEDGQGGRDQGEGATLYYRQSAANGALKGRSAITV